MCDLNKDPTKNPVYLEWIKCQEAIGAFDKMILDIRKYGFTFITLLLTANGYLLGTENIPEFVATGIFVVLLVLIIALFRIDRMHEIFVRSTVLRAMRLEEDLNFGLTRCISYWSESLITATWGTVVYALFCLAAFILTITAILKYNDNLDIQNKSGDSAISAAGIHFNEFSRSLDALLEELNIRTIILDATPKGKKDIVDIKSAQKKTSTVGNTSSPLTISYLLQTLGTRLAFWISCVFLLLAFVYILIYHFYTKLSEKNIQKSS